MWDLDHKESWVLENLCVLLLLLLLFFTVVLEKALKNPLDCKEIRLANPKEVCPDCSFERLMLQLKLQYFCLIKKDPDAGKDWRQEEKQGTEYEMVAWHHQLDGHEIAQGLGVGDGQRSLACCSTWDCKKPDMTEQLKWTELKPVLQ